MTTTHHYQGQALNCRPDETLLDALLRQGASVVFSCRSGSCQTCLLRCTSGQAPAAAQKGLPEALRQAGYLLACQCRPSSDLHLAAPEARDLRTTAVLGAVAQGSGGFVKLDFELTRSLAWQPGDSLMIVDPAGPEHDLRLTLTGDPENGDWLMQAVLSPEPGLTLPDWLQGDGELGHEFEVWQPLPASRTGDDSPTPPTDPALWHELDQGRLVRTVLEDFYAQVFEDPLLQPFFAKVTRERAIGQQYAFLCQLMTGEPCYLGDRPRNAHHWMVISDALLDHRQALMVATLQRHGLSRAQIARWTRFEEHWRRDMVKTAPIPKVLHGITYPLDGFDHEVLSSGSLCDHCGAEVAAGTRVLYHRRLGTISCGACAGQTGAGPAPEA